MRVLVLIPDSSYPTGAIIDEWRSIYPQIQVLNRGRRLQLNEPNDLSGRELVRVYISELMPDALLGMTFDQVDQTHVVPASLSDHQRRYLRYLEEMAALGRAAKGFDRMPLEVAWHLGLVGGTSCDWGGCDSDATSARYDALIRLWLPVCVVHEFAPDSDQSVRGSTPQTGVGNGGTRSGG